MSKAEELLNSLSNGEPAVHLADPSTEPHIVIGSDRYITVPDELKRLAVQYDHDIETVTFDCPRYWDEHDMSEMSIYINYLRADETSGTYRADNVEVDAEDSSIMHFNWTISKNVTMTSGKLVFIVCVRKTDEDNNEKNHWNSELCKDCYVSEGLEYDGEILEELYPDIIEQWYQEVLGVISEVENVKQELISMRDSGEFDGATFTPSLSDDGELSWTNNKARENPPTVNIHGATFIPNVSDTCDLSWTNDKGLENPKTVNIRGKDAVSPTVQVTDIQGGHKITITDANGVKSFDVMDTIIDSTDAVSALLNRFVYIGGDEPASGPSMWFDTNLTLITE